MGWAGELFTANFWETGMRKCFFYSFYLKGDGVKPGRRSRSPDKLPWVNRKRFPDPVNAGARKSG
jgi:hypothetical protein